MKTCNSCGNQYDKCFQVTLANDDHIYFFDSFECAINKLAPVCLHCKCKVIGHGLEEAEKIYCCNHCAKKEGSSHLKDRHP